MQKRIIRSLLAAALLVLGASAIGQKKPLDHSVYDSWKSVQSTSITDDGKWVMYRIVPQEGDAVVEVKSTDGSKTYTFDRGSSVAFTQDGKYVVATVVPKLEDTKKAKKDKVKPEDQPKNSLLILNLATGEKTEMDRVSSFSIAEDDSGWIVYKPEPPKPEPAKPAQPAAKPEEKKEEPKQEEKKEEQKPKKKTEHKPGDTIVLRHLDSGKEEKLENVVQYRFSEDGKVLVYTVSTKDGAGDGIVWYDLRSGTKTNVLTQLGRYSKIALDKKAGQLAYLTDKDDYAAKKPSHTLYLYNRGTGNTSTIAKEGTAGIQKDWWVADSAISFSESGNRLLFNLQPKPEEEKTDDTPADEKVNLDVWHWRDPLLMPQQLLQANMERNRSYGAVYHIRENKVVQYETPEVPNLSISDQGDGEYAIGSSNMAYRIESSWYPGPADVWLVNVKTGEPKKILNKFEGFATMSPAGKWVYAYDEAARKAFSLDPKTLKRTDLEIPYPIWNELDDHPAHPGSYGIAGWTTGDARVLVYDNFDIWSVDPTGANAAVNVTDGFGRSNQIHLRYMRLDPEERNIDPNKPMFLGGLDERTKAQGFYRDQVNGNGWPQKVLVADKRFGLLTKAKKAETIYYTRMDFVEYPDLWLADNLNFQNPRKISNANPQQSEYNWGKAELISYRSNDGIELQGILIKPEDFDYAKKYPMIVYFYERDSDTLHQYRSPAPSASTVNLPYFASNGYVIFIPDIPYKVGYPGESAMNAILPGVQEVLRRGYVDPKKMGLQGQSWGGYQTLYLVTESDMFACAFAGAPVSNMFSAYGGIRWGSGLVRQMQYEMGQSRIGGTPWNATLRYLENSPVFFADKIKTPLLLMNNDKDGAVPWYQGIEIFTAMRRLEKPAWLLVYNDDDHNLMKRHNRKDLSIRMAQFFDHYLKGAPMPLWMSEGVPAIKKGKDYGLGYPEKK